VVCDGMWCRCVTAIHAIKSLARGLVRRACQAYITTCCACLCGNTQDGKEEEWEWQLKASLGCHTTPRLAASSRGTSSRGTTSPISGQEVLLVAERAGRRMEAEEAEVEAEVMVAALECAECSWRRSSTADEPQDELSWARTGNPSWTDLRCQMTESDT